VGRSTLTEAAAVKATAWEERVLLFSSSLPDVSGIVKEEAMVLLLLLLLFSIAGVAGRRIFFFLEILGDGEMRGELVLKPQGQTRKKKSTTYNIRTVDANNLYLFVTNNC
jgi:hypothetical protein